jgi:hypothetical protein
LQLQLRFLLLKRIQEPQYMDYYSGCSNLLNFSSKAIELMEQGLFIHLHLSDYSKLVSFSYGYFSMLKLRAKHLFQCFIA